MLERRLDPGSLSCPGSSYIAQVANSSYTSQIPTRPHGHNTGTRISESPSWGLAYTQNMVPLHCSMPQPQSKPHFEPHNLQIPYANTIPSTSHHDSVSVVPLSTQSKNEPTNRSKPRDSEYPRDNYKPYSTAASPERIPNSQVEQFPKLKKKKSHNVAIEEIGLSPDKSIEQSLDVSLRHRLASVFSIQRKNIHKYKGDCSSSICSTGSCSPRKTQTNSVNNMAQTSLCYPDGFSDIPLAFPSAERIISRYNRSRSLSYPPRQPYFSRENLVSFYAQESNYQQPVSNDISSIGSMIPAAGMEMELLPQMSLPNVQGQRLVGAENARYISYDDVSQPTNSTELTRRNTISNTQIVKESRSLPSNQYFQINSHISCLKDSKSKTDLNGTGNYFTQSTIASYISTNVNLNAKEVTAYVCSIIKPFCPSKKTVNTMTAHPIFQKAVGFLVILLAGQVIFFQLRGLSWSLISRIESCFIVSFALLTVTGLYAACDETAAFAASKVKNVPESQRRARMFYRIPYTLLASEESSPIQQRVSAARSLSSSMPSVLKNSIPVTWKIGDRLVNLTFEQRREMELEALKQSRAAVSEDYGDKRIKKKLRFKLND